MEGMETIMKLKVGVWEKKIAQKVVYPKYTAAWILQKVGFNNIT